MSKDLIISQLVEELAALTKRFTELELRYQELERENQALRAKNQLLKKENAELRARLNSNSHNSHKPPSSDGYRKNPALPKKPKGKPGGQKGHRGRTLQQIETPDIIQDHYPNACSCGHPVMADSCNLLEKRQVFDLPEPKLEVTEHRIFGGICPGCGKKVRGEAPESINAPVQYGQNTKAFVVLLNAYYKLPIKKIRTLFSDMFGYPINESTICTAAGQCYHKLGPSEETIKSKIIESNTAHADETGIRVEGKLAWLHTATTLLYTYLFVHEKRGTGALSSSKSILDKFYGWLVHDCWKSYFTYQRFRHALCCAHILRELEALIENGQSQWAKIFKVFLMKLYYMPHEERVKRRKPIESGYAAICEIGLKEEPIPQRKKGQRGRLKKTKGRNLVERLQECQQAVLAFAFNEDVPFTNNLAERDIRPAKLKQKISNCFRTFDGAEIYARIEGFISTARKHNRNVFNELCNTFSGHNFLNA